MFKYQMLLRHKLLLPKPMFKYFHKKDYNIHWSTSVDITVEPVPSGTENEAIIRP